MTNYINEDSMHRGNGYPAMNNNYIHGGLNSVDMNMNGSLSNPYHFSVEHLASFPQELASNYLTPDAALTKLKNISLEGGLWAQKMNMNISNNKVIMANEEQQVIEEYPVEQISLCITILDDPMFENLLIFSTKLSKDKVGAVHLFQCKVNQAASICDIINRAREQKHSPIQKKQIETRTEMHQSRQVVKAVKAIEDQVQVAKQNPPQAASVNGQMTPYQDAKITRDVEILNKCIEEIENFVVMLKRINEARKNLQNKKKKNKKKVENILILQSQPPPDDKIIDICQKFKHALNLLGKLQQHISEPNSPELVHYLFIPLNIIVKVTGIEKARSVVNPLITRVCVNLLNSCLDSREYHFWQSLGPNWTLTKEDEYFRDQHFQPYIPVFADGWQPPEIITNEKQEAAARSTAAKFARMQQNNLAVDVGGPMNLTKSTQYQPDSPIKNNMQTSTDQVDSSKKLLVGIVVYDYLAHNNKELTIRAGEKVYIIDNTRRWWLVCNDHGEQGYVPSTVLEIPAADDSTVVESRERMSPKISPVSYANDTPVQHVNHGVQTSFNNGLSSPGYNTQNYMNGNAFPPPPSPSGNIQNKETKTVTPVVISVQLPDGGRVETNTDGTRIVATPAGMVNAQKGRNVASNTSFTKKEIIHSTTTNTTVIPIVKQQRRTPDSTPSPIMQQTTPPAMPYQQQTTPPIMPYQQRQTTPPNVQNYSKSSSFKTRTSVTEDIQTSAIPVAASMPPPPPPPPVQPISYTKVQPTPVNSKNVSASPHEVKGVDLQSELKNRLSLHQADESAPFEQSIDSIDSVDVFIPLYKSSTADDVSRWLYKLGFSNRTIETLKGKTAKDLFKVKKEEMIALIGTEEGIQLYDELQVQNGAKTRHKTMTEFQKALYKRVQKREELSQQAHALHHIPETTGSSSSSTPSQEKDVTKSFEESASLIKKQKEELEKLKNRRTPENSTFSSFSADAQAKTKL